MTGQPTPWAGRSHRGGWIYRCREPAPAPVGATQPHDLHQLDRHIDAEERERSKPGRTLLTPPSSDVEIRSTSSNVFDGLLFTSLEDDDGHVPIHGNIKQVYQTERDR